MSLFEIFKPEDFLLFVRNFNITIAASGTLETGSKVQYLCMLVSGESLSQIELLSTDVKST